MNAEPGWMLLFFIAANFVLAGLGARVGDRGHGAEVWFASLRKPPSFPPAWIFSRVWALVLIATGVAGWIIWQHTPFGRAQTALVLYGFQLLINAVWQGMTVGLRQLQRGLAVGGLLWGVITLTAIVAFGIPGGAGYWLIPYWLWVGFGFLLNRRLLQLNPAAAAAPSDGDTAP